jgi:hypothetical protein
MPTFSFAPKGLLRAGRKGLTPRRIKVGCDLPGPQLPPHITRQRDDGEHRRPRDRIRLHLIEQDIGFGQIDRRLVPAAQLAAHEGQQGAAGQHATANVHSQRGRQAFDGFGLHAECVEAQAQSVVRHRVRDVQAQGLQQDLDGLFITLRREKMVAEHLQVLRAGVRLRRHVKHEARRLVVAPRVNQAFAHELARQHVQRLLLQDAAGVPDGLVGFARAKASPRQVQSI